MLAHKFYLFFLSSKRHYPIIIYTTKPLSNIHFRFLFQFRTNTCTYSFVVVVAIGHNHPSYEGTSDLGQVYISLLYLDKLVRLQIQLVVVLLLLITLFHVSKFGFTLLSGGCNLEGVFRDETCVHLLVLLVFLFFVLLLFILLFRCSLFVFLVLLCFRFSSWICYRSRSYYGSRSWYDWGLYSRGRDY